MSVSLGPFIMCFLAVVVLTAYVSFIIYLKKDILYEGMRFAFGVIVLILIRMMVPFNFPFTITIGSTRILPPISRVLFYHIGGTNLRPADILMVVWVVEAARRLLKMYRENKEYRRFLAPFRVKNISDYPIIEKMLNEYGVPEMPVYVVTASISPELYGAWKTALIIPDYDLNPQEIEFVCRHELEHHKNHDLWLKMFVDLVVCIQWFNPFVYFLQRELILAYEMSNDNKVLEKCDDQQRTAYGLGLVKISKLQKNGSVKQRGLAFTKDNDRNIARRIQFVIDKEHGKPGMRGFSIFLRYIIVIVIFVVSLVFVPEAHRIDEKVKESTFGYEQDCYIIESDLEFKLYVDNEYVFSFSSIPVEFQNVPIIKEKVK